MHVRTCSLKHSNDKANSAKRSQMKTDVETSSLPKQVASYPACSLLIRSCYQLCAMAGYDVQNCFAELAIHRIHKHYVHVVKVLTLALDLSGCKIVVQSQKVTTIWKEAVSHVSLKSGKKQAKDSILGTKPLYLNSILFRTSLWFLQVHIQHLTPQDTKAYASEPVSLQGTSLPYLLPEDVAKKICFFTSQ